MYGKKQVITGLKTKSEPKGLAIIKLLIKQKGIKYTEEHKFSSTRRFRFDIAIIPLKLAIEYEGLKSTKSRHTTITGYTKDTEKYNLAQLEGWTVLRYTARNYGDFENDLNKYLNKTT